PWPFVSGKSTPEDTYIPLALGSWAWFVPPAALRCISSRPFLVRELSSRHCSAVMQMRVRLVSEPVALSVRQIFFSFSSSCLSSAAPATPLVASRAPAINTLARLFISPPHSVVQDWRRLPYQSSR